MHLKLGFDANLAMDLVALLAAIFVFPYLCNPQSLAQSTTVPLVSRLLYQTDIQLHHLFNSCIMAPIRYSDIFTHMTGAPHFSSNALLTLFNLAMVKNYYLAHLVRFIRKNLLSIVQFCTNYALLMLIAFIFLIAPLVSLLY